MIEQAVSLAFLRSITLWRGRFVANCSDFSTNERYILDPKDVYGENFPGETFRVLKKKEIKQFGEYRTRRLVLDAWDRLGGK